MEFSQFANKSSHLNKKVFEKGRGIKEVNQNIICIKWGILVFSVDSVAIDRI